ncbi:MAG TPA: PEP-CTERM sorting domain-containing protein [Candidatus Sulfotelmatobacter sp.]|nr:PEP-CTERM sorting domain-containing protein [Candidatus Sulfotelmatobacter sp.]
MKISIAWLARLSGIIMLLALAPGLRADGAYNVVTDFSNTSNPNGVWSYYYTDAATGSTQTLYTTAQAGGGGTTGILPYWATSLAQPDNVFIVQNTSGSAVTSSTVIQPNDTLRLDPQGYSVAVVFTAPSAGTYTITGNFLGIDIAEGTHPVEILDDGTVIWSGTISTYGQDDPFDLSESLSAGDVITFYVGTGTVPNSIPACNVPSTGLNYCNLGTGLDGTVALPEPSTLPLLAAGLLGLVFLSGCRRILPRHT